MNNPNAFADMQSPAHNELVAALADEIRFSHISPVGQMERMAKRFRFETGGTLCPTSSALISVYQRLNAPYLEPLLSAEKENIRWTPARTRISCEQERTTCHFRKMERIEPCGPC